MYWHEARRQQRERARLAIGFAIAGAVVLGGLVYLQAFPHSLLAVGCLRRRLRLLHDASRGGQRSSLRQPHGDDHDDGGRGLRSRPALARRGDRWSAWGSFPGTCGTPLVPAGGQLRPTGVVRSRCIGVLTVFLQFANTSDDGRLVARHGTALDRGARLGRRCRRSWQRQPLPGVLHRQSRLRKAAQSIPGRTWAN